MKKKVLNNSTLTLLITLITVVVCLHNIDNLSSSVLPPKVIYHGYRIYDLVEQQHLACAQAIEILERGNKYIYYFSCLKSDKVLFVSDKETLRAKEAYNRGIITAEDLYKLGIIKRMVIKNGN